MVRLRLDPRVQGRIDPSDVVQEAYLEVCQKLADYVKDPKLPFFLWLRLLTGQKLALAHRQHLGVQARAAGREVSLYRGAYPAASSAALAAKLLGRLTTPSQAAVRAELKLRLQEALNSMDELDREVLTLRHFEQLSNAETAQVLGIKETAACNRYVRALERLRGILAGAPGGLGGL
jgi:RNA polymerase sigma-70 factor (ECF subfamily)